jgi:hypothetical protein
MQARRQASAQYARYAQDQFTKDESGISDSEDWRDETGRPASRWLPTVDRIVSRM